MIFFCYQENKGGGEVNELLGMDSICIRFIIILLKSNQKNIVKSQCYIDYSFFIIYNTDIK